MTTNALLNTAQFTIGLGADHLQLSDADRERLLAVDRQLAVRFMFDFDDGPEMVSAWRVQHDLRRGPGKGGMRYSPDVNLDEVTGLASIMSVKNSLAGLPFGGAKGGVSIDPSRLDDADRERLAGQLAKQFAGFVGPHVDILGPDVGTGPDDMRAFTAAWQNTMGADSTAVATGKPMDFGGIDVRIGATALGCAQAVRVARKFTGLDSSARVAIQGFGSLGAELASLLSDDGHPIVAVSDSGGGIRNADGLDIDAVRKAKSENGSVTSADGERIESLDALMTEADIVIPAALQSIIDHDLAGTIQASLVIEGSNAPSTINGIRAMNDRNITVVPDFAANAGGVIGSFHEWRTNLGEAFDDPRQDMIDRTTLLNELMWERSQTDRTDLRTAASAMALEGILDS